MMRMKLEIQGEVWNIISSYAPQTGCTENEKDQFWETIDSEMQAVSGVGAPNEDGIKVLDFVTAYQMGILNTSYQKRKNHLVTYSNAGRETQIDYIMLRKEHASGCRTRKVLPSKAITTRHRTLIADLVAKKTRQRRAAGRKRLRWWKLKDDETKEKFRRNLVERLLNIDEATTENVEQWLEEIAEQIKKCGEELCGKSTGKKKTGLESWWWNDETESAVWEKKERKKD